MDVEILLRGAEKLGEVYVMEGAKEKIAALRARYSRVTTSLAHYEGKVARQARELERMNRPEDWECDEVDEDEDAQNEEGEDEEVEITEEDLRREEEEIKKLERKKKELEDRVSGMERDLGGLLR
jgi:chromosome segregation ATPase